jgi:hypothetical protein
MDGCQQFGISLFTEPSQTKTSRLDDAQFPIKGIPPRKGSNGLRNLPTDAWNLRDCLSICSEYGLH